MIQEKRHGHDVQQPTPAVEVRVGRAIQTRQVASQNLFGNKNLTAEQPLAKSILQTNDAGTMIYSELL